VELGLLTHVYSIRDFGLYKSSDVVILMLYARWGLSHRTSLGLEPNTFPIIPDEGIPKDVWRVTKLRKIQGIGIFCLAFVALSIFPLHPRSGSQDPYESLNESHAPYTPDAVWPVDRFPPD
jgi:hypothetical protein